MMLERVQEALLSGPATLMAPKKSCWRLLALFLLLILGIPGETFMLNGIMKGPNLSDDMRWYKSLDRNQQPIYSDKISQNTPWVTRIIQGVQEDLSRQISNIRLEDARTYYDGPFKAGNPERKCKPKKGKGIRRIRVEATSPSPIKHNAPVSVICSIEGSDPSEITLVWLKTDEAFDGGKADIMLQNLDRASSIKKSLQSVTSQKENNFTCWVMHPAQPPFNANLVLKFRMEPKVGPHPLEEGHWLLHNLVLWLGVFLNKIVAAFLLQFFILRKFRKSQHQDRQLPVMD